jgi:nitrous oxidase accessory protein NosD
MGSATAATLFPIVCGENINDCVIEKLTLDGNRAKNDNLDGNHAGCIFLQDCSRITIRGVTARNYNGDGISWQICHDVRVEDCLSENHAGLGLHPGSGSQRPIIRNNKLKGNDIGIFFCWGVKYGLAEHNLIEGNRVGISIGHRDTDNLITKNEIRGSKDAGVLFRPERGKDFAGHRNRLIKNRLIDNGGDTSAAIDIQGATEAIVLEGNEILETRLPAERIGVRLGALTRDIQIKGNRIEGFAKDVVQMP